LFHSQLIAFMRGLTDGPILVLTPHGRDSAVVEATLKQTCFPTLSCRDLGEMIQALAKGASAAVVADEALLAEDPRPLADWVAGQPSWSDFPFILFTMRSVGDPPQQGALLDMLGNVTVLERPLHPVTLLTAVRSALRTRRRQRESERHLIDRKEALEALRRSEQRLQRLTETLEERVDERTRELAAANRQLMAQIEERKRAEAALRQAQRLEAVGQLTSGVAHDFNNLLTAVLGNLELIQERTRDEASSKLLRTAVHAVERGAKLTEQLLAFSRKQRLAPRAMDVNLVLKEMFTLLQSTIGTTVRVDMALRSGLWAAMVDPTQIELVILNLAINARDAMAIGGRLTIETANATLGPPEHEEDPPAGDYVMVAVADTGAGMSEETLARAFEPFFTTKEPGRGSGLGLSMVYGVARQSGGGVRIESRLGEGTTVKVYLPRAAAQPGDLPIGASMEMAPAGNEMILLVDDDGDVRDVAANMLRSLGYRVIEAGSGGAALDLLDREASVDLVLLDFAMPGMNGVEVARSAREKRPDLPILFATGFADTMKLSGADVGQPILQKPYRTADLAAALRQVLGRVHGSPGIRSSHPSSMQC
jgi:signal transduction histidine kinase/ActR/RegA family two-component response regulator